MNSAGQTVVSGNLFRQCNETESCSVNSVVEAKTLVAYKILVHNRYGVVILATRWYPTLNSLR